MNLKRCKEVLEAAGVVFAPGLTPAELRAAEEHYGFAFPPDLRSYLAYALPTGDRFPNWRDLDDATTKRALDWPLQGICFDIEHNSLWLADWGTRPADLRAAFDIARDRVLAAPPLIPIYAHRYLPGLPIEPGNPVFSVYQSDIIYYGADLESYLRNEYSGYFDSQPFIVPGEVRKIAFWSRFAEEDL